MGVIEIIASALKLAIMTIGYAIEEAKKHEQEVLDAKAKRSLFDGAALRALTELRTEAAEEKAKVDAVDNVVDLEAKRDAAAQSDPKQK